jgi:xylulokinase
MKYVLGIDLGTSAVKVLLVNQDGEVCQEVSNPYPLLQERIGYSEQNPEDWMEQTIRSITEILKNFDCDVNDIDGVSFSGQMHGLVLIDKDQQLVRNAILWNDTRTTKQCQQIYEEFGRENLLQVTKNPALEGFTLPKLMWVKEFEEEIFQKAETFLLPKDYVRFRMTGQLNIDYSDAAGTLLLDVTHKKWSVELCKQFGIPLELCPPLVESHTCVGTLTQDFANRTGLSPKTKVFAGGADNACGAIGAGILANGHTLCSIGTSGVILSYEEGSKTNFDGKVHFFNHAKTDAYYSMGVTLSAGHSLSWFKDSFAKDMTFDELLKDIEFVPVGANGLLFTPYLVGERTPHADPKIRGSFIGMDASHTRSHFVRSVVEGITFSLMESIEIFRESGKEINQVISIGGGANNPTWLQMQADIFNAEIVKLRNEQGPAIGAATIAAFGCGWFSSLKECADVFIKPDKSYLPKQENVKVYGELYQLYKKVYQHTKEINKELYHFRN